MFYDDAKRDPDPQIDIDPCDLDHFELDTDQPIKGELWRGGSPNPWREFDLPTGFHTVNAGGPVKVVGDIVRLWIGTV